MRAGAGIAVAASLLCGLAYPLFWTSPLAPAAMIALKASAVALLAALQPRDQVDEVSRPRRGFEAAHHGEQGQLGRGPGVQLAGAVTHIVTDHVVATMDPVELRPLILREHAELARVIIKGEHTTARQLMTEHFERQHRYYAEHWPSRLRQLIEWR